MALSSMPVKPFHRRRVQQTRQPSFRKRRRLDPYRCQIPTAEEGAEETLLQLVIGHPPQCEPSHRRSQSSHSIEERPPPSGMPQEREKGIGMRQCSIEVENSDRSRVDGHIRSAKEANVELDDAVVKKQP